MLATNDVRQSAVDNIEAWSEDYLEQTDAFRLVPDAGTADYRLAIRVRNDANPNIAMAMLTGLTLYLIPSKATDSFTTDVQLIDKAGNQVAKKRYKHDLEMWQQLFLVFGAPFATLSGVSETMWREVIQDVAVWTAESIEGV